MCKHARALVLCLIGTAAFAAPPAANDPWIRATPPGVQTAAAYARLTGAGTTDRLVGARTDAADRVEIHTHMMQDGVMAMKQIEALAIPADGAAVLAPGGDHLMLIGLHRPLAPGDTVTFILVFEKSGEVVVQFPVRDARAEPQHAH